MANILVLPSEVVGEAESGNSYAFPADNIIMSDKATSVEEAINNKPGEKIPGAEEGSVGGEIFNDYTDNIASGEYSHAEGRGTTASGSISHAEGFYTIASGNASHSEGYGATASGMGSHAEGYGTTASYMGSHAEGISATASGNASHAEGSYTEAASGNQHVQGKYNIVDSEGIYAHIVGWGTSDSSRANIHTINTIGDGWFAGKVSAGTVETPSNPTEANDLITKKYFDENIVKDYTELNNIPTMNSIPISGDKSAVDYGLKPKDFEVTITGEEGALASDTSSADIISAIENNRDVYVLYNGYKYEYISSTSTSVTFEREFGLHKISIKIDGTTVTHTNTEYEVSGSSSSGVGQLYPNEVDDATNPTGSPGEIFNVYEDDENSGVIKNIASGAYSHAEGASTTASGQASHAEGFGTIASGNVSHAEGTDTTASGIGSHTEGEHTEAIGDSSHAEGTFTTASGNYSHAEGSDTEASGVGSHAEGQRTTSSNQGSHSEGVNTSASGRAAHSEGHSATASGMCSHAEGFQTTASGAYSHAEGSFTTASGDISHAEGSGAEASGAISHAEGDTTTASGAYSHAEGMCTIAASEAQHVQGKYNIEDADGVYAHIVGWGKRTSSRANIHTITTTGDGWFAGKVSAGTEDSPATPTADNDLITKKYFDDNVGSSGGGGEQGITNIIVHTASVGPTMVGSFENLIQLPSGYMYDNTVILGFYISTDSSIYFGGSCPAFNIRITNTNYIQINITNNTYQQELIGASIRFILANINLPTGTSLTN